MNYQENLKRAIDLCNRATELDEGAANEDKKEAGSGDWGKVFNAYIQAIDNFQFIWKWEKNPQSKKMYIVCNLEV